MGLETGSVEVWPASSVNVRKTGSLHGPSALVAFNTCRRPGGRVRELEELIEAVFIDIDLRG